MTVPEISIIIPVYNAARYLRECVDSILQQSFANFEIILIDDGSTDDSPQICDGYAACDQRVKVVHKPNAGVSAARNDGLDRARAEYITFVDSDDWVEAGYIQTLLNYKQYDIVFFPHRFIYGTGFTSEFKFREESGDATTMWGIVSNLKNNDTHVNFYGYTWNKMFRREIIEKFHVRFVEGLRVSEDEVYTLDYCTHAQSIKVLPTCLYNYRVLSTGLTATKNSSREQELLAKSFLEVINREKNEGINSAMMSSVVLVLYRAFLATTSFIRAHKLLRQMQNLAHTEAVRMTYFERKLQVILTSTSIVGFLYWLTRLPKNHILNRKS